MGLPLAELTLEKTPEVLISFSIPCPCGLNNLSCGVFKFGSEDSRQNLNKAICLNCGRECEPIIKVQTKGLQKAVRFELHYSTLSTPEYWKMYKFVAPGCTASLNGEVIGIPQKFEDNQVIKSQTFSFWWENRLGLIPTLVFQQNLPEKG
jgi:hypothetical protein